MFPNMQVTHINIEVFFTAFETCKYLFLKRRQATEMTFWESFAAGAVSGLTCITVSYPQVYYHE